jgi:hypothetical protein
VKARALALATLAAASVPSAAIAAPKTTGPGQRLRILVVINDRYLAVYDQAQSQRGSIVTFDVYNAGKKTHGYELLGRQTGPIKPKHWRHFTVTLLTRGRFPDGSPFDKGPNYHGFFTVY